MAIPVFSEALQKRMKQSLATQGGDLGQELILLVERALEISTISLENATFTQETVVLNEGGTTATLGGAGMELLGDADAVVAFMRVAADTANMEFKAPTAAGIMTLDINADATLLMSANLSVNGVSAINQDVSTTANPTFADITITSFAANWTNAGRTITDLGIVTTVDINGGTADGVIIGGSVASAGTFTNLIGSTDFALASGATVTAILDEDNMASNSDTALVTQQSLVAFVASQVATVDTLQEIMDNGASTTVTIDSNVTALGTGAGGIVIQDVKTDAALQMGEYSGNDITIASNISLTGGFGATAKGTLFIDDGEASLYFNGTQRICVGATFAFMSNPVTGATARLLLSQSSVNLDNGSVSGGGILLGNNTTASVSSADVNNLATIVNSRNSTINTGVTNTVIGAGTGIIAKTNNTFYAPQIGFFQSGVIEGLLQKDTLTSSRAWTLPDATGTIALTADNLSVFAATTSSQLAGVISDETGSGVLVFGTNPTLTGVTTTAVADIGGVFLTSGTTTSSGAGAVAITGTIHEITTTGTGDALTLANGAEGQIIQAVYVAEGAGGDTAILTPTSLGGADTTITFNDLGDSVTLLFTAGAWYVRGSKDAVIA